MSQFLCLYWIFSFVCFYDFFLISQKAIFTQVSYTDMVLVAPIWNHPQETFFFSFWPAFVASFYLTLLLKETSIHFQRPSKSLWIIHYTTTATTHYLQLAELYSGLCLTTVDSCSSCTSNELTLFPYLKLSSHSVPSPYSSLPCLLAASTPLPYPSLAPLNHSASQFAS